MVYEQQLIADTIADILGKIDAVKRRPTVYALHRFERVKWRPDEFFQAVRENPTFVYNTEDGVSPTTPLDVIQEVLERYIDIIEERTGAPAIPNELFSKRAATWYIVRQLQNRGIKATPRGVDFHLRDRGELKSDLVVGKTQLLTRQQLDEFVENWDKLPKRGRPSEEPVAE